MKAEDAIQEIIQEYGRAAATNGAFHSVHEGYAVIAEELDELWDEVKKKARDRDPEQFRREAAQIGAMALRFLVDLL